MNPTEAEKVRGQVGLSPDEARKINESKQSKFKSKSKMNAAANVLAASLVAAST